MLDSLKPAADAKKSVITKLPPRKQWRMTSFFTAQHSVLVAESTIKHPYTHLEPSTALHTGDPQQLCCCSARYHKPTQQVHQKQLLAWSLSFVLKCCSTSVARSSSGSSRAPIPLCRDIVEPLRRQSAVGGFTRISLLEAIPVALAHTDAGFEVHKCERNFPSA